jgi:hypothetical protein
VHSTPANPPPKITIFFFLANGNLFTN